MTVNSLDKRTWNDSQLVAAVAASHSWRGVIRELGLCVTSAVAELGLLGRCADERTRVKAHAMRLGLDLSRLQASDAPEVTYGLKPDIKRLRDAGVAIAATWFLLCGCNASIPMEPTLYDLLVSMVDGVKRVQVKTTTFNKNGWQVQVGRRHYSVGNRGALVPYDPDDLDLFFILDGDLTMYLIPSQVIAGRVSIMLSITPSTSLAMLVF